MRLNRGPGSFNTEVYELPGERRPKSHIPDLCSVSVQKASISRRKVEHTEMGDVVHIWLFLLVIRPSYSLYLKGVDTKALVIKTFFFPA